MTRHGSIVLAAVLLAVVVAVAADRPTPPTGFSWQEVPEVKAAFLKPDGWYFGQVARGDEFIAHITQEDVEKEGRFRTGLVINVFLRSKPGTAVEYAGAFIAKLAEDEGAKIFARKVGPFETFGCRVHRTGGSEPVIMHNLMVAHPKTGTIYLFIFKAPQATWDDAWLKGEEIMKQMAIDDEL